MAGNQPWLESMKSFRRHIDPEIDERLKWTKIGNYHTPAEQVQPVSPLHYYQSQRFSSVANNRPQFRVPSPAAELYSPRAHANANATFSNTEWERLRKTENKLKKSLKLVKGINQNKEGNAKKKAELTSLLEDITNEYQSVYTLYDNLSTEVRKLFIPETEAGSSPSSSSSPNYSSDWNSEMEFHTPQAPETPRELDRNASKDKVINKAPSVEVMSPHSEEQVFKDVEIEDEQILSMRQQLHDREEEISSLTKKHLAFQDKKLAEIMILEDKIKSLKEFEGKVESTRKENSGLKSQIEELQQQFKEKDNQLNTLVGKLQEQTDVLRKDLEFLGREKTDLDSQLKVKSQELSELRVDQEKLREKLANQDLENQIMSTKNEAYDLRIENEKLQARIFVLETIMNEKDNELSSLRDKLGELNNLRQEVKDLHHAKKGLELQLKQEKQNSSKLTEDCKQLQTKLSDAKSNYQAAEKKIEEMADEFFMKCEDQVRLMSRRIRVAEQLHVENKEWYRKTKDDYEQTNVELKERLEQNEIWIKNIKEISLAAETTLSSLDDVAFKFQGRTSNFQNRISKVSCELKFAKDWITRKNKAISHVREDIHCLLAQLDDKEAEILLYREKVWKSENRLREMEKLMDEKEEGMLALQEEKREAIRQLCVWIDYHRSHSDYYKKILADMNVAMKKAR